MLCSECSAAIDLGAFVVEELEVFVAEVLGGVVFGLAPGRSGLSFHS